jgi:hypothetical protein
MALAGPFYFAWVEPSETSFNGSHLRMDEYIFSAKRTLAEGEKPLLEIEIQNPHTGILSVGRKYWAWFSWYNGSTVVPIFFGRVVGAPVEIFEEVIRIQLVADPINYKERIQRVAESLKYRPFYDPVFIDVIQRDDPNTILEAHAKVWDVNPVTHACTANDIIIGADGNVDFTGDDHFYDSMQMTIGQPPATAILMDASVHWKQTGRGFIDLGKHVYTTLSGDGIIADWPKPLQQLGGGWSVYASEAHDDGNTANAIMHMETWSYTNKEKKHNNGDTMSMNMSYSTPIGGSGGGMSSIIKAEYQSGFIDPGFVVTDEKTGEILAEHETVLISPSVQETTAYVLGWNISTALILQYKAEQERTERIIFLVRADTQPVLVDPQLDQNSETINKSGTDVGIPIINLLNWTTVSGSHVEIGQIIFPDNPKIPGGKSVQIAVTEGTAGTVTPAFSDIPGFTTNDGSVVWSSMGVASPPENAVDWTANSHVNLGQMILPSRPLYTSWFNLTQPARIALPPSSFLIANDAAQTGVATVSESTVIQASNGSFQICTVAGTGQLQEPAFSKVWGTKTIDGSVEWTSLGMSLPSGNTYHVATTAGITNPTPHVIPPFNESLHGITNDGSVQWTCIGAGDIPVGGLHQGDVWASTYFAQDRGRESLEYLAALVRARLLYRARCIQIDFDCEYGRGVGLTTRQTVTLHDPRIPGGIALGKVKGTVLTVADTGIAGCKVTLACTAGKGNAIAEDNGTPSYVVNGYVDDNYQQHDNVIAVLPTTTDLGYAPPVYTPSNDDLTFPLTKEQVLMVDRLHVGSQYLAVTSAFNSMKQAQAGIAAPVEINMAHSISEQRINLNTVPRALQLNPIWQEFQIKPVIGQTFNKVYTVQFSNLTIPKGIDLQSSTIT